MAKKATAPDTNATPPVGADNSSKEPKAAKAAKVGRPAGFSTKDSDLFKPAEVEPTGPESRIAPQAQAIVNIVKAAGPNGITRGELVEQMEGVVTTRQPQARILSYYQKLITDKGFVTITSPKAETAPASTETADQGEVKA